MFTDALRHHYPHAMPATELLDRSVHACRSLGVEPGAALAMEALCRDELVFAFEAGITDRWGPAFDLGSLAGMVLLGRTGLQAAMHHAPSDDGRHRYVVYAMPHIGIDADGRVGLVERPGQASASTACGALAAFQRELADGRIVADFDPGDVEQSLLRQRLLGRLRYGHVPDLVELTELARDAMVDDLRAAASELGGVGDADVVVVTGILIHGPDGVDWVSPGESFSVSGRGDPVAVQL